MERLATILAVSLLASAIVLWAAQTVHADPSSQPIGITFTISDAATGLLTDVEGVAGGQVTMRVKAQGAIDMAGFDCTLKFDNTVVTIPSGGVDLRLPAEWIAFANPINVEGVVKIAAVRNGLIPGSDILDIVDVTFDLTPGSPGQLTTLIFQRCFASDFSVPLNDIPLTPVGGTITIQSGPVNIGGLTSFLVDGSGPSAGGIAALTGATVAVFVVLAAGGWYIRRRWLGKGTA